MISKEVVKGEKQQHQDECEQPVVAIREVNKPHSPSLVTAFLANTPVPPSTIFYSHDLPLSGPPSHVVLPVGLLMRLTWQYDWLPPRKGIIGEKGEQMNEPETETTVEVIVSHNGEEVEKFTLTESGSAETVRNDSDILGDVASRLADINPPLEGAVVTVLTVIKLTVIQRRWLAGLNGGAV